MSLAAPKIDPLFEQGVAEFVQTGRTVLNLPHPPCIQAAVDGVRALISSPERDQWTFFVPRHGEPNDEPDDGLVRKGKTHTYEKTDNKWFFHYRPSLRGHLAKHNVQTDSYGEMLLAAGDYLHRYYENMVLRIADALDLHLPGYRIPDLMRHEAGRSVNVLRILAYDQGCAATNVNNIVARPHTDRDFLTFHIANSRDGLHLGPEREPYAVQPGKLLAFAGQKLERLTRGHIKAVQHDVQDPDGAAPDGRWSMVFFSHIPGKNGYL
ncbi:MAG: 2OG-Fe(II) oxygenase family protein [Patescibacteria group bacterium]